jgi:hypothetical protein
MRFFFLSMCFSHRLLLVVFLPPWVTVKFVLVVELSSVGHLNELFCVWYAHFFLVGLIQGVDETRIDVLQSGRIFHSELVQVAGFPPQRLVSRPVLINSYANL